MWWKILIAVLCGAYLISPADLSPLFPGIDDIAALAGTVTSILTAVNQFKKTKALSEKTDDKE